MSAVDKGALRALAEQLQAMAEADHFPLEKWCRVSALYRANTQPVAVLALLDRIQELEDAVRQYVAPMPCPAGGICGGNAEIMRVMKEPRP